VFVTLHYVGMTFTFVLYIDVKINVDDLTLFLYIHRIKRPRQRYKRLNKRC